MIMNAKKYTKWGNTRKSGALTYIVTRSLFLALIGAYLMTLSLGIFNEVLIQGKNFSIENCLLYFNISFIIYLPAAACIAIIGWHLNELGYEKTTN